jgi:hypothetical protein
MVVAVVELALALLLVALLALGARMAWRAWTGAGALGTGAGALGAGAAPGVLPPGVRAEVAAAIAAARWAPAHDEVDGRTRVLVRKAWTGLDGHPQVLEERVVTSFPADDPEWEVRFIEGMGQARFRCTYLNAEECS